MKKRRWLCLLLALVLIVPAIVVPVMANTPITYPNIVGSYTCKGTIYEMKIDGNIITKYKTSTLIIAATDNCTVSEAYLTIGGISDNFTIGLEGYVGGGTKKPRLALYAIGDVTIPEDVPVLEGDLAIVNAQIRLNRDGTVKGIKGWVEGLCNLSTPYQYFGRLSGRYTPPPS